MTSNNVNNVEKDTISLNKVIITFRNWYKYIIKNILTVAIVALIGAITGLVISLITPITYVAETSFVLENNKSNGMANAYSSISAKFGLGSSSGDGLFSDDNNIIMLLKSRNMIFKTLYSYYDFQGNKQLLIKKYAEIYGYTKSWQKNYRLKDFSFHANQKSRTIKEDSIAKAFYKNIIKKNLYVGKPDKEEDLIVLQTASPDAEFSRAFNITLVKNTTEFYLNIQTKKLLDNVNILQHQVDSVTRLLNSAISGVAISSEANPNANPAFQRLKVPSQKRMVDVEINKGILEELMKNLELAKISLRNETPLLQIVDEPLLPLDKKHIGKLKGIILGTLLATIICLLALTLKRYILLALNDKSL